MADDAVFEELDRLAKVVVEEAVHRHVGKPDRLDEATAEYFDLLRNSLSVALVGRPAEQYPLDQSPPWINRHRNEG